MNFFVNLSGSSGQKNLMPVSLVLVQKTINGIGTSLNFNKKVFFSPPYYDIISLFTWTKQKCFFGWPAFIQPIRAIEKALIG